VDPVTLFLNQDPPVTDSHAAKALPNAEKYVVIAYTTPDGKVTPEGARILWPIACTPK
jgi:hypothetical protein